MKPIGILALAAQFAPRLVQIGRGTWIAISVGLLTLFVLLIWATIALFGWAWGQGKSLTDGAPEAVRIITSQVEQAVPGAREALGDLVPALKPEPPPRDVSGSDVGPVGRYPGLPRSHWHRDGREITVRYEGRADYVAVLNHYAQSFVAQGYTQNVVSATPEGEAHDYRKGGERVRFKIAQLPQGKVKATIIAGLP
ncbi:MAG: hypothetical protein Q8M20_04795 [Rhodocyclaceae bacterium]|nr:hypothetical protein [Rhodocyclaceae bacterium]MDZ4214078.1 hypothetical protein [Rhodocyclaceae bacterium]